MKTKMCLLAAACAAWVHAVPDSGRPVTACGMVVATDVAKNDGQTDVADALQRLIDANPNRTIYFPDGVYLISRPLLTPAAPARSVSLRLADFAVIKAGPDWKDAEALIRLGASHPANDINSNGSNYSLTGGVLDGSGVADGVSIDGGRETSIRDVSIKHTRVGVHIKRGANSGSSDADITHVNIVGTGKPDSVGVLVEGYDNTFTDMRIASVQTGVLLKSGGNSLRNIHPLYIYTKHVDDAGYLSSRAFDDRNGHNWYDYCYSDQFATGFCTDRSVSSIFDKCFCLWYSDRGARHVAFRANGKFNSVVTDLRIGFREKNSARTNIVLSVEVPGGKGVLDRALFSRARTDDDAYKTYLKGDVID